MKMGEKKIVTPKLLKEGRLCVICLNTQLLFVFSANKHTNICYHITL